jgi:hypothetical protein
LASRRRANRLVLGFAGTVVALVLTLSTGIHRFSSGGSGGTAREPNIEVDFRKVVRPLAAGAFSMAETGYQAPSVLVNDALQQQRMRQLGVSYLRIHLRFSVSGDASSKVVCGGSGCDTGPSGDDWIQSIKRTGAQPIVIVTANSTIDAANLVRRFNVDAGSGSVDPRLPEYVSKWIIGNEPNANGYSASLYSSRFNEEVAAMKAVDPKISVGGPALGWFDRSWLEQFLQLSGTQVDFVDFHGYPQQGVTAGDVSTLFRWAADTGNDVAQLRNLIRATVPRRARRIGIQVGEWSLNWGGNAQGDSNFNAVWTADVLGHIVGNGGVSIYFGSKGNALKWADGTNVDDFGRVVTLHLDDPKAPFHGYGMFTGEGLFRGFGTRIVNATTRLPNVDVFASGGPRNIVVVNKDPLTPQRAVFRLKGISSGSVSAWQKNQAVPFQDAPRQLTSVKIKNGEFSVLLPAMSVTTFVIAD